MSIICIMYESIKYYSSPKIWILWQIGVLILPIIPSLGTILIVLIAIINWIKYKKLLCKQPLNLLLGILSLWLIFTAFLAPYPSEAFLGLANYLPLFFGFSSIHIIFSTLTQLRQIAWLIVIPSFLVVILGLGQLFLGWYIPPILGWELVTGGEPTGRMSSVFIYANFLAIYLQIVLILALGLWLEIYIHFKEKKFIFKSIEDFNFPFILLVIIQKIKLTKNFIWDFNKDESKIFIFLSIGILLDSIGLILTSSRNSWIVLFLGIIAFLLYLGWNKFILALGIMISAILWSSFGSDPLKTWLRKIIPIYIWSRLSDEMYPNRPIETLRTTQWNFAWNLIKESPITGSGLRNFTPLYETKWNLWLGHPHNLFLMFTAETGFVGMILLSSFVGWIIIQSVLLLKRFSAQSNIILFSYIVAFSSCILFNCLDVSIFDLRVNILSWILIFTLGGITSFYNSSFVYLKTS